MLVLSKDQEMIPPVYVIDAHAQKFHIFQLLLLILKAFAQCTPSLHATALTSCIVLCAAAERSVASTNSSATYCQQLPAPHQTRLPPPFHHASHGLWDVPVYHTTRRHIGEYLALNASILTLRFHLLFRTLNIMMHKLNTLRTGSFKLFKPPFPGFLTILTL